VDGTPTYTEKEWIKVVIKRYLIHTYKCGKKKIAQEALVIDPNVIQ